MIEARNVSIEIHSQPILQDASCRLERGITCILGPNGAGKSTLLKCLSGGTPPTRGAVFIDNKKLNHFAPKELAQRRAVLGQNLDIAFPFKAIDIAMMGRAPHPGGGNSAQDREICAQALDLMALNDIQDRVYNSLSGGEKQRIQIARVLSQITFTDQDLTGRYLFLDEPTSALDIKYQSLLKDVLLDLSAKGLTICTIIHDINLACAIADQTLMMKDGKIISTFKADTALDADHIEQIYDIKPNKTRTASGKVLFHF